MKTIQQAILDSADFTIISTDLDGTIRVFNKTAENLLGYRADEVVGKHTPAIFHSPKEMEERAATLTRELNMPVHPGFDVFAAKARLGVPDEKEWSYVRKDGALIPVLLSVTALSDSSGAVTGFLGIGKDISERRHTEGRLALFTRAIEETIDGVQITDLDGYLIYSNKAAEEMYGFKIDELRGRNVNEMNVDSGFAPGIIVPSIKKNGRWSGELLVRHKTGREFPVWLSASVVRNNNGRAVAIIGILRDITGQKQAERTLQQSHERFLAMLDGLDALVYAADRETHEILFLNEYGRKTFGQGTGRICWQAIQTGQNGPCSFCTNDKLLNERGEPTGVYVWEFRNTINNRWYEIRDRAIPWIDDRLVRLEIAVDITERKLAEEALRAEKVLSDRIIAERDRAEKELRRAHDDLEKRVQERTAELKEANERLQQDAAELKKIQDDLRESESKYRAIVENTGTATVIIEPDTFISLANSEFEIFSGYSRKELEGKKSWTEFVLHEDLARMKEYHTQRRRGSTAVPRNYEFRFLDRTGVTKNVFLSVAVIPGTSKSVASLLDITERKQAEERLQEQLHFLQVLIDTIPNPIYYKDSQGSFLGCNRAFERSMGFGRDQILGKTSHDLASKEAADIHHEMDLKLFEEGGTQSYEASAVFADGTSHTVIFNKACFRKKDGAVGGLVGIMVDVTEHRKLEDQLRQAQKMEAIGLLAGGIAHDFNNLLTAIIGYSELLGLENEIELPYHGKVRAINEAALRAAGLTRQLLAFSRRQMLEMKVVNLNDLIDNFAKFLRRIIGEDIILEFHTGKSVRNIMADPGQIEQILMNLAVNARDAMPRGGRIVIETSNREAGKHPKAENETLQHFAYVVLSIMDTGIGMTKEVEDKIFEPFFTTKEFGRGTGLGLSTVYGIVKQHEGEIQVESEPGKGTIFTIYLPAIEKAIAPQPENNAIPVGGTERVLIVDDDKQVLEVMGALLNSLGYKILGASSPAEALRISELSNDPIDLLLTDVIMPGMNGKELALTIGVKHPETAVIFMSGYTDQAIGHQGIIEPGINFIQKPVMLHKLAVKMREVLDQPRGSR